MAEPLSTRSLAAILQVLGDIRLAVLAATAVLGIGAADAVQRTAVVLLALGAVWLSSRPPAFLQTGSSRVWALTSFDLLVAILVLAITGVDSLALVYVAMTAATAALRLGRIGAVVSTSAVAVIHGFVLLDGAGWLDPDVVVVVLVRLALVGISAVGAARLRELLMSRQALAQEVQELRERSILEQERSRLAREMHDSLAKTLHGVVLLTTRLRRRLERDQHGLATDAQLIEESLLVAQQEGRQVLASLRREPVHDLRDALAQLAGRWQAEHGVPISLDLPSGEPPLDEEAKAELVKASAEILENVHRHAGASWARLALEQDDGQVEVVIADDGVGLPAPDLTSLSGCGHFGLVGVHERMSRIGGGVRIGSLSRALLGDRPGTEVRLHVALDRPQTQRVIDLSEFDLVRPGSPTTVTTTVTRSVLP